MEYVPLGATGLRVSVAGLGGGGFARLGLRDGKSEAEVVALVRSALDLGINLIDTAADYGTEEVVGKAIRSVPRSDVVVSTKVSVSRTAVWATPEEVVASLEKSLRALATDHVDIFLLHGLLPQAYDYAHERIVPALLREKEKGKLRFIGVTEHQSGDPHHEMLLRAARDEAWNVVMVAFHMMHQTARAALFPQILADRRIGTLLMMAVRSIFSRPERLQLAMRELVASGEISAASVDIENPLAFLVHEGGAASVTEAAYRFARHEPGVDVVLFGTGNPDHLRANIATLLKPPLPEVDRDKVRRLFGHLVGVGLDAWPARASA